MKWQKLGNIFAPNSNFDWMVSHAANPFAEYLEGDVFRVYFTCRDSLQRSHIAWVDINIRTRSILNLAQKPLLRPGELGTFDDSGVALGWILDINNEKLFYYLGWNLSVTVPWRNSIGLARLNRNNLELERVSLAPIIDRHKVDPYSISYPCILKINGEYLMWYGSNLSWGKQSESMLHVIKEASSVDGYNWNREGNVAIGLCNDEYAISKPCVLKDSDKFRMWYSYRGHSYRIGYAESLDGHDWIRLDNESGIDVSSDGWDSEMICYAHLFDHKGDRYMLYNGNGYGQTGFGLAVLDRSN